MKKTFDFHDTILMAHLLFNGQNKSLSLDNLSFEFLDLEKIKFEDLENSGSENQNLFDFAKKEFSFKNLDLKTASKYACEDSFSTFRLFEIFEEKIKNENLSEIYNLERKLVLVLENMEKIGVKFDKKKSKILNQELEKKLENLENKIFEISGEKFNVNSSKQLSYILFEKLDFPTQGIKKTIYGFSTNVRSLTKLQNSEKNSENFKIIDLILEYRELEKLRNTYVNKLPKTVKSDNRIHTNYIQHAVITGRLASKNPNLQNIPKNKSVKSLFVAKENFKFVSMDYSQAELRIMADFSRDSDLIKAFENNSDIHTITASKLFEKPPEKISKKERNTGKIINFSIIYGVSAYGLSENLRISVPEADDLIKKFFKSFPKIKSFIDNTISQARRENFVKTKMGRKIHLAMNSVNKFVQKQNERLAVNGIIQGTQAEIIKLAMIDIHEFLKEKEMKIKMLLQIHDELVFEVPENLADQKNEIIQNIKKIMEKSSSKILNLKIPVDIEISKNL